MRENNYAETVDVVIVGGGSAGAVLANRLSADPERTVLLVEGGPAYALDEYPTVLRDPARVGGDAEHDWGLTATIDDTGRVIPTPRGKVLGGSSAVNAAVALHPAPTTSRSGRRTGSPDGPSRRCSRPTGRWR